MYDVLAFADFEHTFWLETEGFKGRLGAVLSQKQSDGKYHSSHLPTRVLRGQKKSIKHQNWNSWPSSGLSWINSMNTYNILCQNQ